jgi:hypothetical protein
VIFDKNGKETLEAIKSELFGLAEKEQYFHASGSNQMNVDFRLKINVENILRLVVENCTHKNSFLTFEAQNLKDLFKNPNAFLGSNY